jgi:hypothetical protein
LQDLNITQAAKYTLGEARLQQRSGSSVYRQAQGGKKTYVPGDLKGKCTALTISKIRLSSVFFLYGKTASTITVSKPNERTSSAIRQ